MTKGKCIICNKKTDHNILFICNSKKCIKKFSELTTKLILFGFILKLKKELESSNNN